MVRRRIWRVLVLSHQGRGRIFLVRGEASLCAGGERQSANGFCDDVSVEERRIQRLSGFDACVNGGVSGNDGLPWIGLCASCLLSASGLSGCACPWSGPSSSPCPSTCPVAFPESDHVDDPVTGSSCAPSTCPVLPLCLAVCRGNGLSYGRMTCRTSSLLMSLAASCRALATTLCLPRAAPLSRFAPAMHPVALSSSSASHCGSLAQEAAPCLVVHFLRSSRNCDFATFCAVGDHCSPAPAAA